MWRPGGSGEIVFQGKPTPGSSRRAIYGIQPDGTGLRFIGAIGHDDQDFQDPAFSPDGSTLAYWNFEPDVGLGIEPVHA